MADMLHATSSEIREELKKLDARRSRLRKLLAIAEEDEGKAPEPKPEVVPAPAPDGPLVSDELTPARAEPTPARVEPMPARVDRKSGR